jgi:hypothetical protein
MNLFLVSNFGPMFLLCTLQLFFARGFLTQSEHQQNNTWQIVTGQLASLCDQRFVSVFFGNLNVISIDNKHVLTFTFENNIWLLHSHSNNVVFEGLYILRGMKSFPAASNDQNANAHWSGENRQ